MPSVPPEQQWSILSRHAQVVPAEELREALGSGRSLRVKFGVDPTAPHVHLGWAVPLRKLRAFQDLGHTAVLIVGDFTARIGDPSGQNKTRPMLTADEVRAFADNLLEQVRLILDTERLEVRYNSSWIEPLGVEGLLRLASQHTVARMLERDDFANRYAAGNPITVTEFLYPLLQGYDSVAVEADVEIGGNDQLFNLHVGRHLQIAHGQRPQALLTVPLLEGTDGVEKMSQSKGNYIGVTESPDEIFGKLMRIPDHLMDRYLRLCTDLPDDEVDVLLAGTAPAEAKRRLAQEVVALYHGAEAAGTARRRFDDVFVRHSVPDDVPSAAVPAGCLGEDGRVHLPKLLKEVGLAPSTTEARRLISQGGVKADGEPLDDEAVDPDALRGRVLQVGRRRFVRIT
ncbi:MAG TPA: tyrosine--tRNA ligase [Actinomycetota bacterium]|nr:tyrosine--tRNA ligase [Actinomycetota bacterium]